MTFATNVGTLVLVAVMTASCGSTMRGMLEKGDAPDQQANVGQELAMPPDLRLPAPGTAPAPAAQEAAAPGYSDAATAVPAERPQYGDDIYTQAGISIYKPDGTRKTDAELRAELQQYYIAKKKQKNPNYGTVFNMGNIFKDE